MPRSRRSRRRTRQIRIRRLRVAGLLIVVAAIAAAVDDQLLASSSSTTSFYSTPSPTSTTSGSPTAEAATDARRDSARDDADSSLPDDATVFDDELPGVANLEPDLLDALRRAANDAADDGVEFEVNSGWRSRKYQERLLEEAIAKYGSATEAARWVATPDTSPHVSGNAVDIAPSEATAWLSEHGARYGLCQIYRNEPWHYELRPDAIHQGCPAQYADPTHDPRMQQ